MIIHLFQSLPPTPTPLPYVTPPVDIGGVTFWEYTDPAIQGWHLAGGMATGFQAIILLACLAFILFSLYATAKRISTEKND